MKPSTTIKFENAGYYLLGLIILVLLGFWNSYFSKIFSQSGDFNFYFHFHAIVAFLWILMVIIQPILIKRRQLGLHRRIGRLSYYLIGLIFISVLLLVHHRHSINEENLGLRLLVPLKDLIILGTVYFIAMKYRKNTAIHARAMIASGLVFIEPSLLRTIRNYLDVPAPYMVTAFTVYLLLIVLTIISWKHKSGRWVFPFVLLMYLIVHGILLSGIQIGVLENFARWFIQLPLT
jgi:hypothetical protein